MSVRIRRARPTDLPKARSLLEAERPLIPDDLWRCLPRLLVDFLVTERLRLFVIEETDPPALRFLGGSAFLNPLLYERIVRHPTESVVATSLCLQYHGGQALLNRREVAEANRRGDLILLNFFGTLGGLINGSATLHDAALRSTTAWTFFHAGFNYREILTESADAVQARLYAQAPMPLARHRLSLSGQPTWLFRITRDDALGNPAAWPLFTMVQATPPRFHFTKQQQQELELALLDFSDRDVMRELNLTEDSVKKRWRSIYRRAARIEPALTEHRVGADLRRDLLQRLRYNLAELRPFR
jgi:hypothetical protein